MGVVSHQALGQLEGKVDPRRVAFQALWRVHGGAYADIALDQTLQKSILEGRDRRLVTELVYGCVRRQRTLDALLDQLADKPNQPPKLRTILHLGLYQLRYLGGVPPAIAVHTTVELAKMEGFRGLAKFVNALLRRYSRLSGWQEPDLLQATDTSQEKPNDQSNEQLNERSNEQLSQRSSQHSNQHLIDPLQLPTNPIQRLGLLHSYPDWIIDLWVQQLGESQAEQLATWFNAPPHLDLRINLQQTTLAAVANHFQSVDLQVQRLPGLPQALRFVELPGPIQTLPGYEDGWWMVQDSSAQLVSHLVDPQPGEVVIDACGAPGGKSTHLAELMGDQGIVWVCDRNRARLRKVEENARRLRLTSIRICEGDSRNLPQFLQQADRVLVDAPCSGLGTLHRHADARWRQQPQTVSELAKLQQELLGHGATWVKPGGILVYSTCTLHPQENEWVVNDFLLQHSGWTLDLPSIDSTLNIQVSDSGWVQIWPHFHDMDGFFVARFKAPSS